MTNESERIQQLEKQIELLMKVADKSRLALHTPQEDIGKQVRVSTYRARADEEPVLVVGWSGCNAQAGGKDFVRVTKKEGVVEEQTTIVYLDADTEELKRQQGLLDRTKDSVKLAEREKEISKLKETMEVEMELDDFYKNLEKEWVDVLGTKTLEGKTYFLFKWKGEEREMAIEFVN